MAVPLVAPVAVPADELVGPAPSSFGEESAQLGSPVSSGKNSALSSRHRRSNPLLTCRGPDFRMDVWLVDEWTGQPSNDASDEHDALAWVNAEEAFGLQLADASQGPTTGLAPHALQESRMGP